MIDAPEIVIPRVLEEASTRRVLTMEYAEGLSPDEACSDATPQELKDLPEWAKKCVPAEDSRTGTSPLIEIR